MLLDLSLMENAKGREIYDKITSRIRKKVPPIFWGFLIAFDW